MNVEPFRIGELGNLRLGGEVVQITTPPRGPRVFTLWTSAGLIEFLETQLLP